MPAQAVQGMSGESLRLCGALVASEGKGHSWKLLVAVLLGMLGEFGDIKKGWTMKKQQCFTEKKPFFVAIWQWTFPLCTGILFFWRSAGDGTFTPTFGNSKAHVSATTYWKRWGFASSRPGSEHVDVAVGMILRHHDCGWKSPGSFVCFFCPNFSWQSQKQRCPLKKGRKVVFQPLYFTRDMSVFVGVLLGTCGKHLEASLLPSKNKKSNNLTLSPDG